MFLFSTTVGQIALTFASKFMCAIALDMVENIPFRHALAYIVIAEQGYGGEALSTLFFLFGFSSVVVGILFSALGKLQLGRIVYYFPAHVLIGCIGGIGTFAQIIMKTWERLPAFNLYPH
jgi:SulP family sulfate permease